LVRGIRGVATKDSTEKRVFLLAARNECQELAAGTECHEALPRPGTSGEGIPGGRLVSAP
jgi:hypothetical protein